MRVGIASDHVGFDLQDDLVAHLRGAGQKIADFGALSRDPGDDYLDFVIPLADALVTGRVERGVAIGGRGVGASICANEIPGIRAALIPDNLSARQNVEDGHMKVLRVGERAAGPSAAWDLVQTFLSSEFGQDERHMRRISKVSSLEQATRSAT